MMTREDYIKQYPGHASMRENVKKDPNRLNYHLMPPTGWMNDPNGLCQKDGIYHIYFQYSPYNSGWDTKLWGHYTTSDFLEFKEEEPFLFSDTESDRDGVYSGSALIDNNEIHYYYTGNVKLHDRKDYDYINEGREQNTIHFVSKEGIEAGEKKVVLRNQDYPKEMSAHVRDPRVFKKEELYYMLLGGRTRANKGCVLLYRSRNLEQFEYCSQITTKQAFGYMWECPDMFELDGQNFLAVCPQGVKTKRYEFENVYQSGYFPIEYDFQCNRGSLGKFKEFDRGFDFYAPQTFEDERGRRILLAWMGIPDADYHNQPTIEYDWQHCMTMPRQLSFRDGQIYQQPLEEMKELRREMWQGSIQEANQKIPSGTCFEMKIEFKTLREFSIQIRKDVWLNWQDKVLCLKMGECGCGRKSRHVKMEEVRNLTVFSDTSSLEIFVNDGQEVFTTRVYQNGEEQHPKFQAENEGLVTYYRLAAYTIKWKDSNAENRQ
ncbi:MAG: glycoside hydrolase family 32 protein [Faecalicatena sp.]|uniref:glycoside hydrolase family 32 protein n=1 Tax=Faecalicatena sp. TaxID=2005360 RepID=UPI00258EB967|nr:glycoside hydrolase family 32 protein [Faecalicatena sp.]MCI6465611.1 glycoside hydrolase family 32 protein [Faecalicatena sp.]MDY5618116.1 glycoside hydrolase family 32 protein [Lachnospiraceae bacterium]